MMKTLMVARLGNNKKFGFQDSVFSSPCTSSVVHQCTLVIYRTGASLADASILSTALGGDHNKDSSPVLVDWLIPQLDTNHDDFSIFEYPLLSLLEEVLIYTYIFIYKSVIY